MSTMSLWSYCYRKLRDFVRYYLFSFAVSCYIAGYAGATESVGTVLWPIGFLSAISFRENGKTSLVPVYGVLVDSAFTRANLASNTFLAVIIKILQRYTLSPSQYGIICLIKS
ncbi:MAG: hypothetical protein LBC04_01300 [Holosporaceae bacterium]|jgi:hypothetical protein|nr:hypothetical protein [Holosporaceae bacterium]